MQIRLTVLRPRSGPAGTGSCTDVLVTAPEGTALGAVAGALAGAAGVRGPRSATHVHLYAGPHRVDEQAPLGHPPLVDGAVLALGEPDPDALPDLPPAVAELHVVGGPDAGGVHRLHGPEIRVGRSSEADVPLDDPDVSRLHLSLHLAPDGRITVRDLGSTNGTTVDGRFLRGASAELAPGGLVRLGESTLQVGPGASAVPRQPVPDGQGHLRLATAGPAAPRGGPTIFPATAEPAAPAGRVARALRSRLGRGPSEPPPVERQAGAMARQSAAERERRPDPAALLLAALGPGPRLWERGPSHPDALALRLGTADRQSGAALPVTVDLRSAGSLGLAGPRARLTGLARSLLAQLAVLHPPSALSVVLLSTAAEDWSWALWLPQLRPAHGQECRLLVGFDPDQAEARLAELGARPAAETARPSTRPSTKPLWSSVEPPQSHAVLPGAAADPARRSTALSEPPATVLLVDGDPGSPGARRALELLVVHGPAVGIHTIFLAERPEELPPGLGMTALITGEVATRLTLHRWATHPDRAELPLAPAPTGDLTHVGLPLPSLGGDGEEIALDAVSPAWAERLARLLAPLREAAPAPRGPLPETVRLLDLLRLDTVTPAKLSARWEELPSGPGSATALLGTARDGLCALDLADEDLTDPAGPGGPHLLVGGARGSGKTELLRTVIASLAVSERPERLAVLVVEGRPADEGSDLRGCADLPHVISRLNPADQPGHGVILTEYLLEELAHREALFGKRGFAAWHAAPALSPALVSAGGAAVRSEARIIGRGTAPGGPSSAAAPARLIVVVDDYDTLLGIAGSRLVRALAAIAQRGGLLGIHLVATTSAPERTADTELDAAAGLRIALRTDHPGDSELLVHLPDAAALSEDAPGRGYLRRPDGGVTAFQTARVSGRIPRTATLRPTVVAIDPAELGAPPTRRPVRELGNGPTDLALLASAVQRAAASA